MPRYTLKILTDFAASHQLRDYPGECARLHGHNWKVEVEVSASQLDQQGMVMDFKDIKHITREVVGRLDHQHLNDCPPFDKTNPTVENLAAHLFAEIGKAMPSYSVQLTAITIWETDRACVRYTE